MASLPRSEGDEVNSGAKWSWWKSGLGPGGWPSVCRWPGRQSRELALDLVKLIKASLAG